MIVDDQRGRELTIVVQAFLASITSLRLQGRRSLLAILGIAVGCAAVITLLNIGHNAENESISTFKNMGTNSLVANFLPRSGSQRPWPKRLDISVLKSAIPVISDAAPLSFYSTRISRSGQIVDANIVGTSMALADILGLSLDHGRFLSSIDGDATYVVVGSQVAVDLATADAPLKLGDRLAIEGYLFEVIGIAASVSQNPLIPVASDESVFVPIDGMRRLKASSELNSLIILVSDMSQLNTAADDLKAYLSYLSPVTEVDVQVPQHLLDGLSRQARTFSNLLAGLGGISLLMGGVGVMNVMLMSVSERRREIGIRMALGARSGDIRNLFLVEAAALTSLGTILGAALGLLAAYMFVQTSGWSFSLAPFSIPLGVACAFTVGQISGLYPALVAARLEPVQALRDD